jgi:hypothetical protein
VLGQTVVTPPALRRLAWFEVTPAQLLDRHVTGDWGELLDEDVRENELSLREGFPLLSSYPACECAGAGAVSTVCGSSRKPTVQQR